MWAQIENGHSSRVDLLYASSLRRSAVFPTRSSSFWCGKALILDS